MRAHEAARQIIERQRAAVIAVADELLEFESVDAERLKELLAGSVVPAASHPSAPAQESPRPS